MNPGYHGCGSVPWSAADLRPLRAAEVSLPSDDQAANEMRSPHMIPRKQLDIGWSDLARGIAGVPFPASGAAAAGAFGADAAIRCLSARSAFDLLLEGLNLPQGSEVLVSALTIPDMARILRLHGLVPVPVDLDPASASVDPACLRAAITPRTRSVLVAHLFGGRAFLDPVFETARERGLFVIEDGAQAFAGPSFRGDPRSDATLFSFGPIKTATALGGGVLFARDADLRDRLRALHERWPAQSPGEYRRRLLRFAFFKALLRPSVYGLAVRLIRLSGRDHDAVVTGAARSFRRGDFRERIRRRPCAALERLMLHRVANYPGSRLEERAAQGAELLRAVPPACRFGAEGGSHSHWVVPLVVPDPEALRRRLLAEGFDATRAASSMTPVAAPSDRPETEPLRAKEAHSGLLYLPAFPDIERRELERLGEIVRDSLEVRD